VSYPATVHISSCLFFTNKAEVPYQSTKTARGGALWLAGDTDLKNSEFLMNQTSYGEGSGGAIYQATGALTTARCRFVGNQVSSGTRSTPTENFEGFPGEGGAIFNQAFLFLTNCAFEANISSGGAGSSVIYSAFPGGRGLGGALASHGMSSVNKCGFLDNRAIGAPGTAIRLHALSGAQANGGGISASAGVLTLINCTFVRSVAQGGPGGIWHWWEPSPPPGPGGEAFGGAVWADGALVSITNCTVSLCQAFIGPSGTTPASLSSTAGAICVRTNFFLESSIVSGNQPVEVSGSFQGGHNLIGVNPRFGEPATDEFGAALLPLLPDSPAIDQAATIPGLSDDQRGVSRPYGLRPDIGAYEWNGTNYYQYFVLGALTPQAGMWRLAVAGPTNQLFRMQVSADLYTWADWSTNRIPAQGFMHLNGLTLSNQAFFRTIAE